MRRRIWLAALCLTGLAHSPAFAQPRSFFCGEDSTVTVTPAAPGTITAGIIDGQTLTLTQVADDPLNFIVGDYGVRIGPDGRSIKVHLPDFGEIDCILQGGGVDAAPATTAARPPERVDAFEARSWGGIVRAGPGQSFARVTSLKEGDPITVIERTDVILNDFAWFRVRFRGGEGYQWGGIVCPVGREVPGAFSKCD